MKINPKCSTVAILATLAPISLASDLHVGSGHPYAEIDDAVAAAFQGDRIFVDAGTYHPFHLAAGIEIRGAGALNTRILSNTPGAFSTITGVPAGVEATISNMGFDHVDPTVFTVNPLLDIFSNAGTVVLQDIEVNLNHGAYHGGPGVHTANSDRLIIQNSKLRGSAGSQFGGVGSSALEAENTSLFITDCSLQATDFTFGEFLSGEPGAAAAVLLRCDARFARVSAFGGSGGTDAFSLVSFPGGAGVDLIGSTLDLVGGPVNTLMGGQGAKFTAASGGPGLSAITGSLVQISLDAVIQGGLDGFGLIAADPLSVESGSSTLPLNFNLPTLSPKPGHVATGASFVLEHSGEPGSIVFPVYSGQLASALALQGFDGLLHLNLNNIVLMPIVVLDGVGLGYNSGVVPAQPSLAGIHVWLQAGEVNGAAIRLSNPARIEIEL